MNERLCPPGFQSKPWAGISQRFQRYSAGLELANAFSVTAQFEGHKPRVGRYFLGFLQKARDWNSRVLKREGLGRDIH